MANGKKKTARPEAGGDRFIPVRDSKHMEVASFLIRKINDVEEATPSLSGNNQKAWSLALNDFDIEKVKIMNVARKPFNYVDGFRNHLEAGYSKVPQTASTRKSRHISSAPETVLDVPQLRDDFYLNLMDWGKQNDLAVALEDCVYLWNAKLKETILLKQMEEENCYISSVSWSNDGSFLAIGTSECKVDHHIAFCLAEGVEPVASGDLEDWWRWRGRGSRPGPGPGLPQLLQPGSVICGTERHLSRLCIRRIGPGHKELAAAP